MPLFRVTYPAYTREEAVVYVEAESEEGLEEQLYEISMQYDLPYFPDPDYWENGDAYFDEVAEIPNEAAQKRFRITNIQGGTETIIEEVQRNDTDD